MYGIRIFSNICFFECVLILVCMVRQLGDYTTGIPFLLLQDGWAISTMPAPKLVQDPFLKGRQAISTILDHFWW
jgi:hypothetical protein